MASNEISIRITADNEASGSMRQTRADAEDLGSGFDRAGESADNAEGRIVGLNDTISGVGAIMAGPGKDGIGAYLQGWADLASGLANAVIPALAQVASAEGRAAIATKANAIAQKVAAAATRAYAVAQRVLNAAMRANPIGIIITVLVLLVAAIVYAYKHSEKFRTIVQAAFRAVKLAAQVLVQGVRAYFGALASVLTTAGNKFRQFYNFAKSALSALLSFARSIPGKIASSFGALYGAITNPVRNAVHAVSSWLDGLLSKAKSIPGRIGKSVLGAINPFAHGGVTGQAASGGTRAGLTLTGENGPELLHLPPGTRVRSNPDTRRLAGGGGGGGETIVRVIVEGTGILRGLREEVRTKGGGSVQVALGRG